MVFLLFIAVGNCPELYPPINGSIAYSINDTLVTAEYSCRVGYSLSDGDVLRYCNDSGIWSGTEPICLDDGMTVCVIMFVYVFVCSERINTPILTCMHIHTHMHTCMYKRMHIQICRCTCTDIHTCWRTYTHMCACTLGRGDVIVILWLLQQKTIQS